MLFGLCRTGMVSIMGAWRIVREPLARQLSQGMGPELPKAGARLRRLAFFIRVPPKIGPLKVLSFEAPVPQAEQRFEDSFDRTLDLYRGYLARHRPRQLNLSNRDFDTGKVTKPADNCLADNTFAKRAIRLADKADCVRKS
jgi:hypothetical protein